jgi:hypothetical protein
MEADDDPTVALRHIIHELRNISCIVLGNLELLRYRADPASTIMIDRAMSGAERVDAVIATLTNLSTRN